MKTILCNEIEFNNIKNQIQTYKIFNNDISFVFLENCILKNSNNGEELIIQITSINTYNNILDVLKIYNLSQFGKYNDQEEFKKMMSKYYNLDNFLVCRVKYIDDGEIHILDDELRNMINLDGASRNNLGLSGCNVLRVKTKNYDDCVLKIQNFISENSIKCEYDAAKYLDGKLPIAKAYYYSCIDGVEYLLSEFIDGEPLYNYRGFGYKLGKELKNFHSFYSCDCPFKKFSTDNMLDNALKNIDVVYFQRGEKFKDYSKEELIEFLKENKPIDDSLIHGDISLPNILVDATDKYNYIDLGNVSISTKYFDIYVLKKSLKINNLEDEFGNILKGYGMKDLDYKYLDWISLIELSYS